ncbi:MAG TPA: hypothetical protein VNY10_16120, partial [Roseiarcus sp.]|nr:hypothetical protein [Roseiarcus sp.]
RMYWAMRITPWRGSSLVIFRASLRKRRSRFERQSPICLARVSTGFSLVLLVASAVAALAAGLTYAFVSPVETAPVRLRAAPETATPEFLD